MVLKLNNFQFNGMSFVQKNGTVMGIHIAPNYTNLFMEDFEQRLSILITHLQDFGSDSLMMFGVFLGVPKMT